MNLVFRLKKNLNKLPIGVGLGSYIAKIPYFVRPGLGKQYSKSQKEMENYKSFSIAQKQDFVFEKVKILCEFAYKQVPFYKKFYDKQNFHPAQLHKFDDLKKIPITSKGEFQQYSLDERSSSLKGSLTNTGGSTGKPMSFYTSPQAIGHQWAHLHEAWGKIGYTHNQLKVIFAGRSNVKGGTEYDLIRHSISVDIYCDFEKIVHDLLIVANKHQIRFLHGYPSALYEFASFCEDKSPELVSKISKSLKGVILNSEFPYDKFRNKIESVFKTKSLPTYGHTERCILAYEDGKKNNYKVMQTYGFAEVVDNRLVGTSYYSFGTPLIRYDTEDELTSYECENDLLKNFQIKEGRKGEFVVDKNDKKIPLTALIFGRHHELFNYCEHIQVFQQQKGDLMVLFTTKNNLSSEDASRLFDQKNLDMDVSFRRLEEPYKTSSGKILLKVPQL